MKKTWGLVVDTTLQGAHVALVSIEENKGRLVHVALVTTHIALQPS